MACHGESTDSRNDGETKDIVSPLSKKVVNCLFLSGVEVSWRLKVNEFSCISGRVHNAKHGMQEMETNNLA